jgi:hypothetical protein
VEAEKAVKKEGKRLFAGASGETSTQARAVHQRLLEKGYARQTEYAGVIEILPESAQEKAALRTAAGALDRADAFYSENMKAFNARNLKTVMDGLRAGEPADPTVLFNAIVKEGHTDLTKKIMQMIGPNLASGVRAADVRAMLDNSKSLLPGQIDGARFVREIEDRIRSGLLETVHGPEMAAKLQRQAQLIAANQGKIDIAVRPGDTAFDIVRRAKDAADAAKAAAKADPLKVLSQETRKVEAEKNKALAAARRGRNTDKLGQLIFDPKIGAVEAADRILASEDLLLASAARFGQDSPEFNALRQVYLMRILQDNMDVAGSMTQIAPEVQNLMFPGVTLDQMKMLAKEMDALLSTRAMSQGAGKSIMAQERVEQPWGAIPGGKATGKLVFGVDAIGRGMLTKYYKFVTELMNNVPLMRYIEKGLKGDEAARARTRALLGRYMKYGGAIGAGAAESQFAAPSPVEQ